MKISILLFLFTLSFSSLWASETKQSNAVKCEEMNCCNSEDSEFKKEEQSANLSPYIGQHDR